MMKPALALLLGLLIVSPLRAEERLAGADDLRHARISEADCARLAPYLAGGADYVPGIAADGRAVAPRRPRWRLPLWEPLRLRI